MKNLEQLIALQQQIIQMSEPLTAEDIKRWALLY